MIIVGWVLYDKGVFAESQYSFSTTYFTQQDINNARSRLGDSIWLNENYDIFLGYRPEWNNKVVFVLNANNLQYLGEGINYYFQISSSNGYGVLSARNSSKTVITPTSQYPSQYIEQCLVDSRRDTANLNQYWLARGTMSNNIINIMPIRCRYNIYDLSTNELIYNSNYGFQEPYFVTSETDIQNWNFDNLEISGGDVPYYTAFPGGTLEDQTTYIELNLEYNYVNYEIGDITRFLTIDEDTSLWTLSIPSIYLTNFINVQNGSTFKFNLYVEQQNPFEQYNISTNEFTFNLTQEQLDKINNDSNKQIQGTIVQQQEQIVQGQQELQNTIMDDTLDESATESIFDFNVDFDNTNVSTAVANLFTTIMNAFTTAEPKDVILPIPFTNKTITIPYNYTEQYVDFRIKAMIGLIWDGLIAIWIIKRIMTIEDFIAEGEFDLIFKNGDVKKEVL